MEFKVPGMSCAHCTSAIETSVKAADPKAQVSCDLGTRSVRIDSTLPATRLSAAIEQAGYEVTTV